MPGAWSLLAYSLVQHFRYRPNQWSAATFPLLLALPALLVGYWGAQTGHLDAFGHEVGTTNYIGYLLLGALYWNFVEVVWGISFSLRRAMRSGVLESLLATPLSRIGLLLAWSGSRALVEVLPSMAAFVLVVAFSGLPSGARLGQALVVFLVSLVGSYGFAFLLFGLTLRFKDAGSLISLVGNTAPLLGGVFFPVALLPEPLRALSLLYPFTYGVDALRGAWFGSPTLFPMPVQLAILAGLSVAYLVLGWAALVGFERSARQRGLEGF